MSESQKTCFLLGRIGNFTEAKEKVEGLKDSMSEITEVNMGQDRWATFLHDPITTEAEIRNRLKAMNFSIIQTVVTKKKN